MRWSVSRRSATAPRPCNAPLPSKRCPRVGHCGRPARCPCMCMCVLIRRAKPVDTPHCVVPPTQTTLRVPALRAPPWLARPRRSQRACHTSSSGPRFAVAAASAGHLAAGAVMRAVWWRTLRDIQQHHRRQRHHTRNASHIHTHHHRVCCWCDIDGHPAERRECLARAPHRGTQRTHACHAQPDAFTVGSNGTSSAAAVHRIVTDERVVR